jgi:hypothetical protein
MSALHPQEQLLVSHLCAISHRSSGKLGQRPVELKVLCQKTPSFIYLSVEADLNALRIEPLLKAVYPRTSNITFYRNLADRSALGACKSILQVVGTMSDQRPSIAFFSVVQ